MSFRNYTPRDGERRHTDPTSTRFNTNARYRQRGRGTNRPIPNRRPTGGDELTGITVSIGRSLTTGGENSRGRSVGRFQQRPRLIRPGPNNNDAGDTKWWRVSIPQAGTLGKERVMTTLRGSSVRQFQPYHYFIDRDSNSGVFFVNSQQDADMLKRMNRKVEVPNHGTLSIMVSPVSTPAAFLDEDLRGHFRDFICNQKFNQQTFQLNLSNLADDEELSALGIYPQLNKRAFIRELIDIINKSLHTTRQMDLGSNNITNLHEFGELQLPNLGMLSLASNQLRSAEELAHLKQLPNLYHLILNNNPITSPNHRQSLSQDELISVVRQKLPQLKRIDNMDLPAQIGFAIDNEAVRLPTSNPHSVPADLQGHLAKFIDQFFGLFDISGRNELHTLYHEQCMFSLCIAPTESSIVQTKSYKYGALIYYSRNLKKIFDDNKRMNLLKHDKKNVMDFLRVNFPLTKHEGNSFHVDVITAANNRLVFTVNGLYREVDTGPNGPVRSFQRTFTCVQTATGAVVIVADHMMIMNATDGQVANLARAAPPPQPPSSSTSTPITGSQSSASVQDQMVQKLSQLTGMNIEYSKLCLSDNAWNYDRALQNFQDLQKTNSIPAIAFQKP